MPTCNMEGWGGALHGKPGVYLEDLKPIMPCQLVILKAREWIGRDFEGLEFCPCNHNQLGTMCRDLNWHSDGTWIYES